jgi:hypothetical protein
MVIIDYQGTTSNFSEKYFCTNGPSNKHKKLGPDPPSSSPDRLPVCLSVCLVWLVDRLVWFDWLVRLVRWSGWLVNWLTGWSSWSGWLVGWLIWLTGWLIWLTGWLVGWVVGWSSLEIAFLFPKLLTGRIDRLSWLCWC